MVKIVRVGTLAVALALVISEPITGETPRLTQPTKHVARASKGARRGRPRKFNRPSRAVTLTLPDDTVEALQRIDEDLSRAIVRVVQPLMDDLPHPAAELTTFGGRAVIVVSPSRTLRERTGVELIPLSDGRALISFDDALSISEIELRLRDALADPSFEREDRPVFEALTDILSGARREDGVSLRQRSIIVLYRSAPGGIVESSAAPPARSA